MSPPFFAPTVILISTSSFDIFVSIVTFAFWGSVTRYEEVSPALFPAGSVVPFLYFSTFTPQLPDVRFSPSTVSSISVPSAPIVSGTSLVILEIFAICDGSVLSLTTVIFTGFPS